MEWTDWWAWVWLGGDPSTDIPLLAREVMGCDNNGSHSPDSVSLFRTVPQQQWPGALCLERNFIIPQALGLSAAAQSLQILQAVVVPSLFMKTTPQYHPLLTWQLIQGGPS